MKQICPHCNEEKRLGIHWVQSSECDYPQYTEQQDDIVKGLLMGDAYLRYKDKAKNPYLAVAMINEKFLKYLDNIFGPLTNGVSMKTKAEKSAEYTESHEFGNGDDGEYHDVYVLRFRSHPHLHKYVSWYDSGSKVFPDDLQLTKDVVRMWYVCDGGMRWGTDWPYVTFYSKNEYHRIEKWIDKIRSLGFDCHKTNEGFEIPYRCLDTFFEWLGEAPAGFEYKWGVEK